MADILTVEVEKLTYARIFKVDEAKREVYGIATEEAPDAEDEMMDYESSKPYFQAWAAHTADVTDGKSMGAVRYMHQLDACGKLVSMEFDDVNKRIIVGAKIVDDSIWNKIVEGVLTGFSIGGRAVKKWRDAINAALTRFTVNPIEVSVVDVPCLPTAVFQYFKADGSVESRKFKRQEEEMAEVMNKDFGSKLDRVWSELQALKKASGIVTKTLSGEDLDADAFAYVVDKADTSTWFLPLMFTAPETKKKAVLAAISKYRFITIPAESLDAVKAKISDVAKSEGLDFAAEDAKAAADFDQIKSSIKGAVVSKSLSSICDVVYILQNMYWVRMDAEWEAMYEGPEGDSRDAAIAAKMRSVITEMIQVLKDLVDDETSELAEEVGKSMNVEDILKGGSLRAHFKKAAAMYEKECDMHKAMADVHTQQADAHKAAGGTGLDEMKAVHKSMADYHKAKADHHSSMSTMCKSHAEHLRKMEDSLTEKSEQDDLSKAGKKPETEPDADDEGSGKKPDGDEDDPEGGKKPEKSDAPEVEKAADGSQKEVPMTQEEITKAIQDAIAALDLTKTVTDAVKAEVATAVPAAIEAAVAPAVTAEVEKSVKNVQAAITEAMPVKVFSVPRGVEKGATGDWKKVTSDDDCGL